MIRIDMTEEPEDEYDLIFKAQNIYRDGELRYVVPIKINEYDTFYIGPNYYEYTKPDYYKYLLDEINNI